MVEKTALEFADKLIEGATNFKEGMVCGREFINWALFESHKAFTEVDGKFCDRHEALNERFTDCAKVGCGPKPAKREVNMMTQYHYTLQFDDIHFVNSEEVSRTLDYMMDCDNKYDVTMDIHKTCFSPSESVDSVVRAMLLMLVNSDRRVVAYCWDCEKYLVGNPGDIVCTYDGTGPDGHDIFRIVIDTVKPPVKDERLFVCIWDEGYVTEGDTAKTEEHDISFFTEAIGYEQEYITCINSLAVGDSYRMLDNGFHVVVRVR